MSRAGWVLSFCVAGLITTGCGEDGGREASTTIPPTTAPTTMPTMTASETGDSTMGPSTTIEPDSTASDPTADSSDTGDGAPLCSYSCVADTDCTVDGADVGFVCQGGECLLGCATADPCIAFYSGWTLFPCAASSACDLDACIVYDGGSGCAFTPDAIPCVDIELVEVQRMNTEGAMVTVCGQPNAICTDLGRGMECHLPCTPTSCGALTCGANGVCECDDFVPCYMEQTGNTCENGECRYTCTAPADCPDTNLDNDQAACG